MVRNIVIGLSAGLFAAIVCAYVERNTRKVKTEGRLRFGIFIFLQGCLCALLLSLIVYSFIHKNLAEEPLSEILAFVGLLIGFGGGTIYSFGEYFLVRGKVSKQGLEFYSPWTGLKN